MNRTNAEPITLAEARLQRRVAGTAKDALLAHVADRGGEANVSLVTRTLELAADTFGPRPIRLSSRRRQILSYQIRLNTRRS